MKFKKLLLLTCCLCTAFLFSQDFDIYVCDAGNFGPPNKILKFDANGNNPEVFIDQNLNWPQDILFLEDQGVVLISNLNTGRITKYDALTGAYIEDFASVAGGPTRMEIGPDNLIYVLQWGGNGTVLRYQQDGTFVDEFTTVGVFQSIGIEWDTSGNIYISSYGNATVRQYDASGNDLGLFINSQLTGPTNIKLDSHGDFLVLDWSAGDIERFDNTGTYLGTFVTGVGQAEGIDFYPNGDFVIGHGLDASVKRYNSNGTLIDEIVSSGSGGLIRPNAVILRDTALSLDDLEKRTSHRIFYNSHGRLFQINNDLLNSDTAIIIYDYTGKRVATINPHQNTLWNANDLAEGLYMVTASYNSLLMKQKIIVN